MDNIKLALLQQLGLSQDLRPKAEDVASMYTLDLITLFCREAHSITTDLTLCHKILTKVHLASYIVEYTCHSVCILARLERRLRTLSHSYYHKLKVLVEGPEPTQTDLPKVGCGSAGR
jgi:hypothetical protein